MSSRSLASRAGRNSSHADSADPQFSLNTPPYPPLKRGGYIPSPVVVCRRFICSSPLSRGVGEAGGVSVPPRRLDSRLHGMTSPRVWRHAPSLDASCVLMCRVDPLADPPSSLNTPCPTSEEGGFVGRNTYGFDNHHPTLKGGPPTLHLHPTQPTANYGLPVSSSLSRGVGGAGGVSGPPRRLDSRLREHDSSEYELPTRVRPAPGEDDAGLKSGTVVGSCAQRSGRSLVNVVLSCRKGQPIFYRIIGVDCFHANRFLVSIDS